MSRKPLTRFERAVVTVTAAGLAAAIALNLATWWSIDQARERDDCYAAGKTVAECGDAGALERAVSSIVTSGGAK